MYLWVANVPFATNVVNALTLPAHVARRPGVRCRSLGRRSRVTSTRRRPITSHARRRHARRSLTSARRRHAASTIGAPPNDCGRSREPRQPIVGASIAARSASGKVRNSLLRQTCRLARPAATSAPRGTAGRALRPRRSGAAIYPAARCGRSLPRKCLLMPWRHIVDASLARPCPDPRSTREYSVLVRVLVLVMNTCPRPRPIRAQVSARAHLSHHPHRVGGEGG